MTFLDICSKIHFHSLTATSKCGNCQTGQYNVVFCCIKLFQVTMMRLCVCVCTSVYVCVYVSYTSKQARQQWAVLEAVCVCVRMCVHVCVCMCFIYKQAGQAAVGNAGGCACYLQSLSLCSSYSCIPDHTHTQAGPILATPERPRSPCPLLESVILGSFSTPLEQPPDLESWLSGFCTLLKGRSGGVLT